MCCPFRMVDAPDKCLDQRRCNQCSSIFIFHPWRRNTSNQKELEWSPAKQRTCFWACTYSVYIYMACTQVHHQFKTLCWPTINQRTDVHSPKKLETPPLKNMIDPSGSGSAPRNKYIVHIKKKKSRRAVSFARYIKSTFRACEAHRVWWTQTCFVWMLTNQTI